jgi:hypothetical protein
MSAISKGYTTISKKWWAIRMMTLMTTMAMAKIFVTACQPNIY